ETRVSFLVAREGCNVHTSIGGHISCHHARNQTVIPKNDAARREIRAAEEAKRASPALRVYGGYYVSDKDGGGSYYSTTTCRVALFIVAIILAPGSDSDRWFDWDR